MSDLFYNPYQFIPVDTRKVKQEHLTTYEPNKGNIEGEESGLDRSENKFVRHDFWHKESLSGRIRCSLSTLSPLVVGAEQKSGDPARPEIPGSVSPYILKRHGYAIPGNSLRGMVSSIAEVISQSTMRVLSPGNIKDQSASLLDAFKNGAGENSVPWSDERSQLTPVEAMFGVVEEAPDIDRGVRNLASRVRFCDAVSKDSVVLDSAVTLKILNSPKLPSPAMYFSALGGQYISKNRLDLNQHEPNGRKYYIPHSSDGEPWKHIEGKDDLQKPLNHMRLRCTPIVKNSYFTFDIYFENLSVQELGLLQTALQPSGQNEQFVHRIGLGKPYGLGHVSINSAKVEVIDRMARYTLNRFMNDSAYVPHQLTPDLSLVDQEEALPALLALADRGSYEDLPICYPYDQAKYQTPQNEGEGFQWFVTNDKGGRKDFLHRTSDKAGVMKPLASGKQRNRD